MIKQPEEMTFTDKNFSMILYGPPGLGKTTLALSAPDPILIDYDNGVSRVKAYHRCPTIMPSTYEEVLKDIKSEDVKNCKTLIIDTGGSFVTYLQDWAMRTNPTINCQKNGALSLKGFGAVKQEFQRFTNHCRDVLRKNVIYVFHSIEEKDKDGNPIQRLLCEGAARNIVWQPCDFGGFMQMIGNQRTISFTPSQEYFAKGCFGISGTEDVPTLGPNDKNDFLTKLFADARGAIEADNAAFAPLREKYDQVMNVVREIINNVTNADEATKAAKDIPGMEHALTSKKEASALLKAKADELGFKWNASSKEYESPKPTEETKETEG